MVFDDLADNGKPDAASSLGGISRRIGAVKPVKNVRQILGCDALTVILDLHLDKISHILDADIDDTPLFVQIFTELLMMLLITRFICSASAITITSSST